jgi:hypothetical protein
MEYLHIVFARLYAILNSHLCKYNSIDTELDKRYESLDDITLAQFHKHVKKYTSLPISSDMCTDELQCVLIDAHNKFFNLLCLLSVNMLNLDEYNHCVLQAVQACEMIHRFDSQEQNIKNAVESGKTTLKMMNIVIFKHESYLQQQHLKNLVDTIYNFYICFNKS